MHVVKGSLLSIILILLAACASNPDDFLVKGSERQLILQSGATEVIVRCYCPKRVVTATAMSTDIVATVQGTYGSAGYHGKQDKPKKMPEGYLRFAVRHEGQRLLLESNEFTYMHHAHLLSSVRIAVPEGVEVKFEVLTRDELYDRTIN